MRTDTLNRRVRFAPPQPHDKRIELSDSDLALFDAIHRHGPLPTHYLHAFVGRNFSRHQHRLTKLYNGTEHENYLVRPPQQFASYYARYQHIVYDINDRSRQLLSEHGKLSPFIVRNDPFVHRLMGACVGASIELACKRAGLRYICRHEILERKGNSIALPVTVPPSQKALVPDELFGIGYGDSYRFFAVEIDRKTESIERSVNDQTAYARKLHSYASVMHSRAYTEVWGLPSLMVLTVTTSATHMKNMVNYLRKADFGFPERFLFKALPTFGASWRIPPILEDILEPWQSTRGEFDIARA